MAPDFYRDLCSAGLRRQHAKDKAEVAPPATGEPKGISAFHPVPVGRETFLAYH